MFNQSGSSGDLVRMFRTMYTESYLADLARQAYDTWTSLERDSGEMLIWLTGLLNFGDPNASGPEGTLLGPIPNLERLKMGFRRLTNEQIMKEYPFINLPPNYEGIYGDLNGCINVPLTLRALSRLVLQYGGKITQYAQVTKITTKPGGGTTVTYLNTQDNTIHIIDSKKVAITSGAYVNHVLRPSFNFELNIKVWEMVYSYFSVNPGPQSTMVPSMWFQFAENTEKGQPSNFFYGFPALPWGVPNTVRVAVDSAARIIDDPDQRTMSPGHKILQHTSDWVKTHITGANPVPNFTGNCLQANVCDNNFVLDFVPNTNNDVVLFTAGWAMKFVPLLGKVLAELMIDGQTQYNISNFKITREGIIKKQFPLIKTIPGKTHFLGGKYAPSSYAQFGRADQVETKPFDLVGSSTPAIVETGAPSPRAPLTKTTRATLLSNLFHAKAGARTDAAQKLHSAHHIIKKQYQDTLYNSPHLRATRTPCAPLPLLDKEPIKVGIVGGGMAGLYAAMILKDLGIDYTIFEASPDRWGGRVYTHHFQELTQLYGYKGIYNYVDFGAMRFPDIPTMQRTFNLFDMVGVARESYILSDDNNFLYYNGVRLTRTEYTEALKRDPDPLHFSVRNGGGVPNMWVDKGADTILGEAFGPILSALNKDFNSGFLELMQNDSLSTRAFLSEYFNKMNVNTQDKMNIVTWLETLNTGSNLYDEAFTESIMDTLDFQDTDAQGEVQWYCITGGTTQLVKGMIEKLQGKLFAGHEVIKMAPSRFGSGVDLTMRTPDMSQIEKSFDHVISTVPLSMLRQIDVSQCNFGFHKRTAMRVMHYDQSTKVALVFKTRWWQKLKKPIFGGQSSTDLFLRTVVYPSQGLEEENAPGILLVSYSWAQDASRMASICLREDLAQRCLEALAVLHDIPLRDLQDQYLNIVKYVDWQRQPFLDGAFALFGPGQFTASFQGAITPEVHGHLHFAGEALSVHHAWIVGSLNSAYRTVHEILAKENMVDKIQELKAKWGEIDQVEYGGVDLDQLVGIKKSDISNSGEYANITHERLKAQGRAYCEPEEGEMEEFLWV